MEPRDYLSMALQRLDLLLQREILRLRASYQLSLDEFRGLYISDEQVNQLVNRAVNYDGPSSAIDELTDKAESLSSDSTGCDDASPWQRLVAEFALSSMEQDLLLLAVAPEIDLKYETLFAYLNNDITRKWPTFGLALRVVARFTEQRTEVRRCLSPEAKLITSGLLQPVNAAGERRSWLATAFAAAPPVSQYLANAASLDPRLAPFVEQQNVSMDWQRLSIATDLENALYHFSRRIVSTKSRWPVVILAGAQGVGRARAAEAVCRELGVSLLLRVDLDGIRASGDSLHDLIRALLLQQRLHGAALYIAGLELLFDKEHQPIPESHRLVKLLTEAKGPMFIPCEANTPWRELLGALPAVCFRFDLPDYAIRLQLWRNAVKTVDANIAGAELEALADRFVLSPAQISAAVESADNARCFSDGDSSVSLRASTLFEAARAQSDQSLGSLATKVKTRHGWDDLVLPRPALQRVKEIVAAIRHRHVVYAEWGFEQRIATGLGLKILFSGASGTGKTMTAGVIAADLGLDLYKIDLSGIVSKYIGDTEKNLDRIFHAAESSNAILFFDEADALFGKRSEVNDAHDRYANIEVAYLLQKIEEYEGVVILASNLSKNIDLAFARRMHYVIEFPLPDEVHREKLWRGMFPAAVPLGADVDFQFLARQFPLAGGDIRNVALEAAFLAAQDGKVVTMKQLAKALARQMMKQGKVPSATDLKQYHGLIDDGT
jgi:ATP-dependent 26S proteasome regulatory subunit